MSFVSITKNTGNVRFDLCVDDMYVPNWQGLIEVGLLEVLSVPLDDGSMEEVYLFKDPIRVPDFKVYYASSIKQATDPYLSAAITRLLYLNPDPDKLLQKRIVEGVLARFIHKVEVESEVLSGTKLIPCLTFDQVNSVLQTILLTDYKAYEPISDRRIFFKRDSKIPKNVKISISLQARSNTVKELIDTLIHETAQYLEEREQLKYITSSRISKESSKLTLHKVNKYSSPRTKQFIEEANKTRFFKTDKSAEKFVKYLELRETGLNKKDACEKLGVSDSTKIEFARIESTLTNNNL